MILTKKHDLDWLKPDRKIPDSSFHPHFDVYPNKKKLLECVKIEIVSEFKLLGIMLDDALTFKSYLSNLRKNVFSKLFSIHRIFFLPFLIRIQFFKTFILPLFDYCNSLLVYFSDSIINQIESLFNFCMYKLLNIELKDLSLDEQCARLSIYNIFPYKYRSFFRFCIFFRKIMNNNILNDLRNRLEPIKYGTRNNDNIFIVPRSRTLAGSRRISIYLPECMNVIIRHSYLLGLSDFKTFIIFNLGNFYRKFLDIKSKVKNHFSTTFDD